MKMYLTELIGTFFLTLVVALSASSDLAPLAIGGVLAVMVYTGGYISGAHYNPAVSIAVSLSRAFGKAKIRGYFLAQLIGALSASLIASGITGTPFSPAPSESILFAPIIAEVLFTLALCYTVLHTAVSKEAKDNQYYGLAIGGMLMISAITAGPISGAVLNPAIGIGAYLANLLTGGTMALGSMLLYVLAPVSGAVLAAIIYGVQKSGK